MNRDKGIELSPKHGLNPVIPICCWCGKQKNEIALLGRIRKADRNGKPIRDTDIEAPKYMVVNYEPCDDCQKAWDESGAVLIFEVSHTPMQSNLPPIGKDNDGTELYPTMRMVGISPDAAKRMMLGVDKPGAKLLMEDVAFSKMFDEALANHGPDIDADAKPGINDYNEETTDSEIPDNSHEASEEKHDFGNVRQKGPVDAYSKKDKH